MKKHRTRVPDFSRKRDAQRSDDPAKPTHDQGQASLHRPPLIVKPRATSSKSGKRGQ